MILSDIDIKNLLQSGELQINPFSEENIRESSIKLHLAPKVLKYKDDNIADLKDEKSFLYDEITLSDNGYEMKPGEFLLASTLEKVSMPNGYMGWIETRGSIARAGIQAHLCDAHIDPGSSLNITLQLKNNANHSIIIYPEIYIVKLYFFEMKSMSEKPYEGKFQNSDSATTFIN